MKKIIKPIIKQFACLALVGLLVGQGSGYLAQKLMVENNIRERVRDALSKIVDNNKYVINVDVDLEISDQVEEQITVLAGRDKSIKVEAKSDDASSIKEDLSSITQSIDIEEETEKSSYSGGLPIPGFEMDFTKSNKKVKNIEKPEPPVISSDTKKPIVVTDLDVESNNQPRVDKVLSRTRPSRAEIKKMYISLILQEGAAPELIENIRQLTMAAAKFDRNRGDKLTIMTASFREKRDQRSAEQIMLKILLKK
jgi:flagellar biosynthesis/type III secretory pathway M-ring protein FliF/YscJ